MWKFPLTSRSVEREYIFLQLLHGCTTLLLESGNFARARNCMKGVWSGDVGLEAVMEESVCGLAMRGSVLSDGRIGSRGLGMWAA
jgi:hypothetical protein